MYGNYNEIISLGFTCTVPSYLKSKKLRNKAYPFDRVAIPMWAVYELIENNFDGFLDNLELKPLFVDNEKEFMVDTKYYTRLSIKTEKFINMLKEGTLRRIERLNNVLADDDGSVLFIRLEEPNHYDDLGERIIFDEYISKYKNDEKYYLEKLSKLLKERHPNLKFKFLFLNSNGDFIDEEHNIVGIPKPEITNYKEHKPNSKFKAVFKLKDEFIKKNIAQ